MKINGVLKPIMALLGGLVALGCSGSGPEQVIVVDGETFIRDNRGEVWDITDAVEKYGMEPEKFFFGIGRHAIPPENNPNVINPGFPGYPSTNSNVGVFGVNISNEKRAYNINDMAAHEIFNDDISGEPYAVAY